MAVGWRLFTILIAMKVYIVPLEKRRCPQTRKEKLLLAITEGVLGSAMLALLSVAIALFLFGPRLDSIAMCLIGALLPFGEEGGFHYTARAISSRMADRLYRISRIPPAYPPLHHPLVWGGLGAAAFYTRHPLLAAFTTGLMMHFLWDLPLRGAPIPLLRNRVVYAVPAWRTSVRTEGALPYPVYLIPGTLARPNFPYFGFALRGEFTCPLVVRPFPLRNIPHALTAWRVLMLISIIALYIAHARGFRSVESWRERFERVYACPPTQVLQLQSKPKMRRTPPGLMDITFHTKILDSLARIASFQIPPKRHLCYLSHRNPIIAAPPALLSAALNHILPLRPRQKAIAHDWDTFVSRLRRFRVRVLLEMIANLFLFGATILFVLTLPFITFPLFVANRCRPALRWVIDHILQAIHLCCDDRALSALLYVVTAPFAGVLGALRVGLVWLEIITFPLAVGGLLGIIVAAFLIQATWGIFKAVMLLLLFGSLYVALGGCFILEAFAIAALILHIYKRALP
ncbi:hypothetical protein [Thermosulfurimonas sp. F29]|uniref:hypothetical protein n=1 Tax=Thermosulfurimonas sp. F29 TaxID=2867247 RepID=UPI001C833832|nr:hypothetical protein [Thermosulfurimonas sp. F29]MBX6424124.1 hypothetical protein [Thermosulfurimonas sp. F29]